MQFKKIILASVLILIPAQSMAFTSTVQTAVKNALVFMNKHPEVIIVGGVAAVFASIGGILIYEDAQKSKAEKDFWNKKSDAEIVNLAAAFIKKVRRQLEPQLTELRASSPNIKADLTTLYYVRDKIITCQTWLNRLKDRSIFGFAQLVKNLKSELIQLKNNMNIFVNNDFVEEFESLQNEVKNSPPVLIAFPPYQYPYGYNYWR